MTDTSDRVEAAREALDLFVLWATNPDAKHDGWEVDQARRAIADQLAASEQAREQAEARVAELEREKTMRRQPMVVTEVRQRMEQAEAEVAVRDRMLKDIIERIALTPERWNGWTTQEVLTDLRARAEDPTEEKGLS